MSEIDREKINEVLNRAKIGDGWTNPKGITRYDIIVDGEIIGHLWKKIDLKDLEIGEVIEKYLGWKVFLIHNGEVVGHIFVRK